MTGIEFLRASRFRNNYTPDERKSRKLLLDRLLLESKRFNSDLSLFFRIAGFYDRSLMIQFCRSPTNLSPGLWLGLIFVAAYGRNVRVRDRES